MLAPQIVQEKKGKVAAANVDFYSGLVYRSMGIPKELFTPIFAMSRVAGWSAHRIEEIIQGRLIGPHISRLCPDRETTTFRSPRGNSITRDTHKYSCIISYYIIDFRKTVPEQGREMVY